jgi:hypothetical protein
VSSPGATSAPSTQAGAIGSASAPAVADEEAPPENDLTSVRLSLVGVAGINGVGYGLGARLELPFAGVLPGTPDGLGIGVDVALTLDWEGIDEQHGILGFQIPVAVYGTWLIGVADGVVLGPRLGVVGMARFGDVQGQSIRGFRMDLVGMVLAGAHVAGRVAGGVSLFGGLDAAIGPRFSFVVSAGVSL